MVIKINPFLTTISQIKINNWVNEWNPVIITIDQKYFNVLMIQIQEKTLIKPNNTILKDCNHCGPNKNGYHCFEYENLFRFSCHCQNYNPDKIIDITNAIL